MKTKHLFGAVLPLTCCLVGGFLQTMCCSNNKCPQTKIIAHRGFWDKAGSIQNSISSLKNAIDIGAYGSELDVWMTKDGVLVIYHDDEYMGEPIEASLSDELLPIHMANGETMPTLEQYIEVAKTQSQTKLIVEIKPHANVDRERYVVAAVVKMIDENGMTDKVDYISFSENICKALIKSNPAHRVAYLLGNKSPKELKEEGYWGLDYERSVLKEKHPEWIKEAKALGLTTNMWEANNVEDMQYFISQGIDYITTDNPQLLKGMLQK